MSRLDIYRKLLNKESPMAIKDMCIDPNFKPGKFRELSEEGIKTNLNIVVGRLRDIMAGPKKGMNPDEVYKMANALSGLVRTGLLLEGREQERAQMVEQVRQEFIALTRSTFSRYPELAQQVEEVMSSIQLAE